MFTAADAKKMRSANIDRVIERFVERSDYLTKALWVESENDKDPISHDPYEMRVGYVVVALIERGFEVNTEEKGADGDRYAEITFSWADTNVSPSDDLIMAEREFELSSSSGGVHGTYRGDSGMVMELNGVAYLAMHGLSVGGSYRDINRRNWKRVK
ncbi:hypothetical protein PQD76_gp25 [Stenotrophomonas phage BUCT626]|uniref:Uncharacterized protein n=1 Tax=Stenotrophomonas phage BUCT626 TaxID=2860376 RepID=A0AC61NLA7_9CAUD|nr:hypothetical protein PQD76_gp25 [Stenotrophomonas phage BUCT626]QYC96729.1 hypothetical protein [Stenotrophomonas phage BUCT626]